MQHLNGETLARLVDDAPDPTERAHVEACDACASELEALRRQTTLLGRLPDLRPAPGDFESIERRLASEGLVRAGARKAYAELDLGGRWMRRAAAVALFFGGAAAGAMMAGAQARPDAGLATAVDAGPTDPAAALVRVERAERDYVAALVQYRALAGEQSAEGAVGDPAARYAALEYLVRAGQVAVRQAPADPFLNGLLASALAEQEAVYRRISESRVGRPDGWF